MIDSQIRYSMIIEWEPQGGVFVVTVPELPGCKTHGATYEEAVRQGQDAILTWLEGTEEDGVAVPPPRYYDLDGPWTWEDVVAKTPELVGAERG